MMVDGKIYGLPAIERRLTPSMREACLEHLVDRAVSVVLPRLELTARYDLSHVLPAMGMIGAFDQRRAEFDGMGTAPDPAERLFLGFVVHQARADRGAILFVGRVMRPDAA